MMTRYKRYLYYFLLCWFPVCDAAGDERELLRINQKSVSLSEFRCFCDEMRNSLPGGSDNPEDFLNLFIDRKLKVCEAESSGVDAPFIENELAAYHRNLLKNYLLPKTSATGEGQEIRILVQQIFKKLPQHIAPAELWRMESLMDSLSREITGNPAVHFPDLVMKFSDDREEYRVGRLEFPEEFESVVFSLGKGDISKPFLTPMGIHIVKVVDILSAPAGADDCTRESSLRPYLEELKKECGYRPYANNIRNLRRGQSVSGPLFALDGRVYTGSDFARYAAVSPGSLSGQYERFEAKAVLEHECSRLEAKHPEVRYQTQAYYDGILAATFDEKIREKAEDEQEVNAWFLSNKKKYQKECSGYKGIVVQCANKKNVKQAKRLVKNLPMEYWADIIRKYFNTEGKQAVKVEEGLFREGDNKYVDKLVFRKGGFAPDPAYPHTLVLGNKTKGPEDSHEIWDQLVADYREELEASLLCSLRAKFGVEINEEVLKTVNNDSGK